MDTTFLLFLQNLRQSLGGIFDPFMLQITALAESATTFLLMAAIYWCIDKSAGQFMALNVSIACTYNQFLKSVFRIERPWVRDARITPVEAAMANAGGYSFPSGHTSRAAATWGALGAWLWQGKGKRAVSGILWTVLALIVFSRNYLGVHTPQDVLAALAMGAVLWIILGKVMKWADQGQNRDIFVCAVGCILCFLPMLKVGCLSNAGAGMGLLIGWAAERHWVNFKTEGSTVGKIIRFAIGAFLILLSLTALPAALRLIMQAKYAGFFSTFITALVITVIYPYFFSNQSRYKIGTIVGVLAFSALIILSAGVTAGQRNMQTKTQESQQIENRQALPKLIAHRGYSGVYPENTLSAFSGAIDIGADMIELDVQQTKDGVIVVFHDNDLTRVAGQEGTIADYTYEELQGFEVGSWFAEEFEGERIPTLAEALEIIRDSGLEVYLELKDIGETEGFVENVLTITEEYGMSERCIFASFQYNYLPFYREHGLRTLYNISEYDVTLPRQSEADYYGLYWENATAEVVEAIHNAGKKAFVWAVDDPAEVTRQIAMGMDGIVTNQPGIVKVAVHPEYEFLNQNYSRSFPMPGLYGSNLPQICEDMIVQGFTKAGNELAVTAYSRSGENNSILFLLDLDGKLIKTLDLGFKAHVGGTAYDEVHDLLWITGQEGEVYALSWTTIQEDDKAGDILYRFQAGIVNHNGSPVASFLDLYDGRLYVGSYVDGAQGTLNCYDITDPGQPALVSQQVIPERIQGVTFEKGQDKEWIILSQGYQTEDSHLLVFPYDADSAEYEEPAAAYVLPEGAEQIEAAEEGIYLLFESAARPYRATARVVNDQIYVVGKGFL